MSSSNISEIANKVKQAISRKGIDNPISNSVNIYSNEEKIKKIEECFTEILNMLSLDQTDDSICDTPSRVAKMYINEMFQGLDYANFPDMTTIDNKMEYNEMVQIQDIALTTTCEHHFITFDGFATVAYIPKDKVLGLSKINRLVRFFSKRPQVQERLTKQILVALQTIVETEDVAVHINAVHFCVKARGVMDQNSSTATYAYGGKFLEDKDLKKQFLDGIKRN
ncbi:GTP cyclohydrolase I (macronuclear) [Tetrahymena thermophila SB210]|uniref:GTP cyclohydrolase 1 n=1 Tax=Tetrahymena thermophila (strain SB210) TaxID=312017 RepID=Q23AG3_TETTS|nr:GTP cyclohydrolase I [Tetrahymena thermophila SB210]EAR93529.1 GTP cyclohydrolase I [Tetrahymena thermophila SB210]|eukprot:XP_001013774.1 GTP cyclohydrolase I [Tetrahymena thermophila SB210]